MKRSDRLLARLQADETADAAVLCIGEADYGCEEHPEDAPPLVWLLLLNKNGEELSREIPESLLDALHLSEGSFCRLSDLRVID